MNYERQQIKFQHSPIIIAENKIGFLVGAPLDTDEEQNGYVGKEALEEKIMELSLFFSSPIMIYEDELNMKILSLNPNDRSIMNKMLDKLSKKFTKKSKEFDGLYWDILLDYILYKYDKTAMDLAKKLANTKWFIDNGLNSDKLIYDNIEQMRKNKSSLREQGRKITQMICWRAMITDNFLRLGEGKIYYVKNDTNYTIENIALYMQEHENEQQQDKFLKEMISKITGTAKKDIIELPIKAAVKRQIFTPTALSVIECILEVLSEK